MALPILLYKIAFMSQNFVYPITPANVPSSVTDPSPAFKKEVSGVMGSILFFFIVYALLLVLSIALVIGCVYAGIAIIINLPRLITIVAGIGLIGVGIMVFIFLVKFLFSVSKYDRSGIVEVKEDEQPALFSFIRQLTVDTQTQFPRKIYLSADVNACVFYDSSFWSMFFPVKKNLQIGLGLVNAVNISEFKAVMAHEFGHFSQRSMKLGSFVYNVNKIIYNMLFDNKGYGSFLQSWANIDGIFAIFASITAGIAQGIQSILRGMYGFINKKYMSLSRQMEFHADAVAASVSGSDSLSTALRRIELAASCYDITLQKCDEFYKQKKLSVNIYPQQKLVLQKIAADYKLPLENGLPQISDEFFNNSNTSRINFKDQWASHPSTEERIKHLDGLAIPAEVLADSAWVIFNNKEELQKLLTQKIYEGITMPQEAGTVDETEFENKLKSDAQQYSFPDVYNGFYDNRQIAVMDDHELDAETKDTSLTLAELFTAEHAALHKKINTTTNDIELVKAINDKRIDTKSFDFDGTKHNRVDAQVVIKKLEEELKELKNLQQGLDRQSVHYFIKQSLKKEAAEGYNLKKAYQSYFELRKKADEYLLQMNGMLEGLAPLYSGQSLQIDNIKSMINQLKRDHEPIFKQKLQYWSSQNVFSDNSELLNKITSFISSDYAYFSDTSFFETELNDLHTLCNESWSAVNDYVFKQFKSILEKQLPYAHQ
jgi:Zn-dependent protease with chaperone function